MRRGVLVGVLVLGAATGCFRPKKPAPTAATSEQVVATPEEVPPEPDLTNPDAGIDPDPAAVVAPERIEDVTTTVGVPDAEPPGATPLPLPGDAGLDPGAIGEAGAMAGAGGMGLTNPAFAGRSGATKARLLAAGGGNAESERAVARGLKWLARQQRKAGNWDFDGDTKDPVAATGMGLLPFLAAGVTHKPGKDPATNDYRANVDAGLKFLVSQQQPNGSFKGSTGMYSHALATTALCEAAGMTNDRALVGPAQKAVNHIVAAQAADGSWGYQPNAPGDTSILGWQVQALTAARSCKELVVDRRAFEKANKFLDGVATGPAKSRYGYKQPGATPTLTAVGLLCRSQTDGWGPDNPGTAAGVEYLLKTWAPTEQKLDLYYYYYATRVVCLARGPAWAKDWNPRMRDLLVKLQVGDDKATNAGSWDPDAAWIGPHAGRLGQTCLSLLTLEVYYRYPPLFKRDADPTDDPPRVK